MGIEEQESTGWVRQRMVPWFSPTLLANAAGRAIVSPIFGTYADQRMTQATIDGFEPADIERATRRHHYTAGDLGADGATVWVDYLADTGDGFESVYAMASLVASDKLSVARKGSKEMHDLPAGNLLILGGDQVYPYPSRDEYMNRFVGPYSMAFSPPTRPRKTFVLPGNHDWYDGLNAFDFLFCQERYGNSSAARIAGLQFPQHRSYFAIRLPHNWWIWGADIQLSQYLDVGQVKYFQAVADEMAKRQADEPEHKIILCTAEPGWQYDVENAKAANENLEVVANIANSGKARICTVLSGDSHHYCRYRNEDLNLSLITAGGGGAFLHPTHQLKSEVKYNWLGTERTFKLNCRPSVTSKGLESSAFPSKTRSFWLAWGDLLFPVWNPTFSMLLGTFYWIMTWMYAQTPIKRDNCPLASPLVEDVLVYARERCGLATSSVWAWLNDLLVVSVQAAVHQFLLGLLALLFLGALVAYADARKTWKKWLMGGLHWAVHLTASVGLYLVLSYWGVWYFAAPYITDLGAKFHLADWVPGVRTAIYILQMIFFGGAVGGIVWGSYLFWSCAIGRRHWNDAFSALRYQNYKNFLRMKLEPEKLTIYPVGLRRVPTGPEWQKKNGRFEPLLALSPELIDGPIVIDASDPKQKAKPLT